MSRLSDFFLKDENIIGHGNFGDIDERYNLLAEKEEVDRSIPQIPQTAVAVIRKTDKPDVQTEPIPQVDSEDDPIQASDWQKVRDADKQQKSNTKPSADETEWEEIRDDNKQESKDPNPSTTGSKRFDDIDEETLRKIYETIHKINEFEKKANELRKLKFAWRDKSK
jgi:hypothetical protein